VLLNRVQTLVATALDEKAAAARRAAAIERRGKNFADLGTVSVPRADLDEIRATTEQIKVQLQTYLAR